MHFRILIGVTSLKYLIIYLFGLWILTDWLKDIFIHTFLTFFLFSTIFFLHTYPWVISLFNIFLILCYNFFCLFISYFYLREIFFGKNLIRITYKSWLRQDLYRLSGTASLARSASRRQPPVGNHLNLPSDNAFRYRSYQYEFSLSNIFLFFIL